MFDPVRVHVIISFGDCSVSRFCPKYWAVPHRSAGAQQVVLEPGDWRLTMGSLPGEDSTGRKMKDARPAQDLQCNGRRTGLRG